MKKIKKIFSILIMCIMLLSITSVAYAQNEDGSSQTGVTTTGVTGTTNTENNEDDDTTETTEESGDTDSETNEGESNSDNDDENNDDGDDDTTEIGRERIRVNDPKGQTVRVSKEIATKARNMYQELKKLGLAEQAQKLQGLTAEDFRTFQKEKLMLAVEKCKEVGIDTEKCEEALQKRLELVKKLGQKDLERVQKLAQNRIKAAEEVEELSEDSDFKKFNGNKEFKAREIVKEKLANVRAKYVKAKENYGQAKEKYIQAKNKFQELKEQQPKCEDDNCPGLKSNANEVLIQASNRVIESLNKLIAQVEASEYLTEEEVTGHLERLNEQLGIVETIKAKVENFDEETSKEEINDAFKELREVTVSVKNALQNSSSKMINSRIGGVIVKSSQLQVKLHRVLERMAENGKGTSEIESLISNFENKISEAKNSFKEAEGQFNQNQYQEGHKYMVQAKEQLAEAQKLLQKIIRTIVNNDGAEELEDSELDEVEELTETDNTTSTNDSDENGEVNSE